MDEQTLAACALAQKALYDDFWDGEAGITRRRLPFDRNEELCYWWHAHVVDALLDAFLRTGDQKYIARIDEELAGTYRENGGTWLNDFYDDMEWMALALLRAYDASGEERYRKIVSVLWQDIKTAWNGNMGGGMSWTKNHPFYKNTPANAPAAILAARLYQRFKAGEDLAWAKRIYDYNRRVLVDPATGFVWDGLNRLEDGKIDYDWAYTYCQGVYLGAGLELWRCTGEEAYLDDAVRTALYSADYFSTRHGGVIPNEGEGDCGLFKGIYLRYTTELYLAQPRAALAPLWAMLQSNAAALIEKGISPAGLIGSRWDEQPGDEVFLCSQLSGIMLLEMKLLVEREGRA